jgi:hypothetical protein
MHHHTCCGTLANMQAEDMVSRRVEPHEPMALEEVADLRAAILDHLEAQGFHLNDQGFIMQAPRDKTAIRQLHGQAVQERRDAARRYFSPKEPELLRALGRPRAIRPENIQPHLTLVENKRSTQADVWRWACLHWSIPTSAGYGRRLRFLVTDRAHDNALIGVIGLGDPVFALAARDSWIQWQAPERRERLACVMDAFVLGAAPPYDSLLGGKLVALLAASREVQDLFRERYGNRVTLIGQRDPQAQLALLTTTSALGRSSVYNRLTLPSGKLAFMPVGWTLGSGDFHLSGALYERLANFARAANPDGKTQRHERWTGNSFRNRREVVTKALDALGLPSRRLRIHGIRRQIYVAPMATNATEFLRGEQLKLQVSTWPVEELAAYWRQRWAVPRAHRIGFADIEHSTWELWPNSRALSNSASPTYNEMCEYG